LIAIHKVSCGFHPFPPFKNEPSSSGLVFKCRLSWGSRAVLVVEVS
jgi:hypothetical protein